MFLVASWVLFDWKHVQKVISWRSFFVSQDFQPTFCWNAQAWSLQVSWVTWNLCQPQAAPCARSLCLCPLTLASKDCGVSWSSAPPPRASLSGWRAKTRRATASRGCPVSPTQTSFQARQPPPYRHILPKPLCSASHTSSISPVTFNPFSLPFVDPPVVSMPDVVKGFYMQPAVIGCSVESDIPYRLRFTRSGITLAEEKFFQWVFPLFVHHCNIWLAFLQIPPDAAASCTHYLLQKN